MSDNGENGKALTAPKRASTGLYVRASAGLRLRDKKVERLARKVRAALPWLEPADFPAVRAWAEFEYLAGQVYAMLRVGSVVNAAGEGKRLLDDYRKLRLAQAVLSRELGMTPASRIAIKANGNKVELDIAAMCAAGIDDAEVVEAGAKEAISDVEPEDGGKDNGNHDG